MENCGCRLLVAGHDGRGSEGSPQEIVWAKDKGIQEKGPMIEYMKR